MFGGQTLAIAAQPLNCTGKLPAPLAGSYFLVASCLAPAAHERGDIVWSATIPHCTDCAPAPSKRSWLSRLGHKKSPNAVMNVVEHYTPEDGCQGVGVEYFRQHYLQ
jgi:hypothetical protein